MRVPTRSAGTRSGVNWMRLNVPPRTSATVLTVSVLARPGTPSRRMWPPAGSATNTRSSIPSCPTITRLTSKRAASRAWRASSGSPAGRRCDCSSVTGLLSNGGSRRSTGGPSKQGKRSVARLVESWPMPLRLITAGESHGPGLTCIVEGLPAGLELIREDVDRDLARRQLGHGRGGRMKIESDAAEVTAGVRHGRTLGSPVSLRIENRDYANWEERMNPWPVEAAVAEVHLPRPGHADLAGVQKYGQ